MKKLAIVATALCGVLATPAIAGPKGDAQMTPQDKIEQAAEASCFAEVRSDIASHMGRNGSPHGQVIRTRAGFTREYDLWWLATYCPDSHVRED